MDSKFRLWPISVFIQMAAGLFFQDDLILQYCPFKGKGGGGRKSYGEMTGGIYPDGCWPALTWWSHATVPLRARGGGEKKVIWRDDWRYLSRWLLACSAMMISRYCPFKGRRGGGRRKKVIWRDDWRYLSRWLLACSAMMNDDETVNHISYLYSFVLL